MQKSDIENIGIGIEIRNLFNKKYYQIRPKNCTANENNIT